MNSLALLARTYDTRALSSIASTSRASPASASEIVLPRPARRTFSFSSSSKQSIHPSPAKRPASSPSTPARLATPLAEVPPPLLFPTSSPSSATSIKSRSKFLAQCYAIVRRVMQEALIWAIPTAARAVKHSTLDADEKPGALDDTGSEDGGDGALEEIAPRSETRDVNLSILLSGALPDDPTARIQLVKAPPDLEPILPSLPPALVNVVPPTPIDESASRSLVGAFGISPLRLFRPSSADAPPIAQSLLPNPFSMSLLTSSPVPSATPGRKPSVTSPHFPPKKTLVLDLDETLIHSTSRPLSYATGGNGVLGLGGLFGKRSQGTGHMVEVILNGRSTLYHVYKRPFVDYFLRKVSGWYTLVIFTASMQEYADPVIDWLDGGRGLFSRRFFRESCTQQQSGSYSKDLAVIDEDLSRICLIDNSPISYSNHPANGIPIEGWISDPSDEALLDLLPVLDSLRFASDVRRILGIRGFFGVE